MSYRKTEPSRGAQPRHASGAKSTDIRILGSVEVLVDGRPVDLGSGRVRRLLALLAAGGDSVCSVERIVNTLWNDPPRSARQQVHNAIRALRKSLREAEAEVSVVTAGEGYRLSASRAAIDASRFHDQIREAENAEGRGELDLAARHFKNALAEWRDEPFCGSDESHQLAAVAATLVEQRLVAVERLAAVHLARGDSDASTADLRRLVSEHPLRESLRALYMRVLNMQGRQAEALDVFEEGRRLLAEELGIDPGQLLRAAHREVLNGGPAGRRAAKPALRAGPEHAEPALVRGRSFLPRDIAEFTGRAEEVRRLVGEVEQARATALVISAIHGMGGVGKTTLAVHLAHRLAKDFPDGQYFVDLLGFNADAAALSPAQALNLLLRDSGVPPELIPADLTGRVSLWRSRLAGQRAIIVLDNAVDVAQVRPVIAGSPGSLVLVSSRHRLSALEGSIALALDVLPPDDGLRLFSLIVGADRVEAEREAAQAAVELCGRLPLAIQVAAARLRDRPAWSVASLVAQLRDERARRRALRVGDRDVMSVLSWSYRHLTGVQQFVFRLLGLVPGPDFDAFTVAALAGLSLDEAAECLEELFEANLVQQRSAERYRLHDLLRDCSRHLAAEHADEAERTRALRRLLDYYLFVVGLWCAPVATKAIFRFALEIGNPPAYFQRPDSAEDALRRLNTEYQNVVAALKVAAELGDSVWTWQLVCSLMPFFATLNYNAESAALLESGLAAARAAGSELGQSACLMGLAHARRMAGLTAEARSLAQEAVALSRRLGDEAREVHQLTGLGVMHMDDNALDEAAKCFSGAQRIARRIRDQKALADLANNLGVIHREQGDFDAAQNHFRTAFSLYEALDVPAASAVIMANLAQISYVRGDYTDALDRSHEALRLSRKAGSRHAEAFAMIGLCVVHRLMRDHGGAMRWGREALDIARDGGVHAAECEALNALGDTYLAAGDVATAERVFDQALELAAARKAQRYLARSREGQAHAARARGEFAAARGLFEQSLESSPSGVVDPSAVRRHLAVDGRGLATCWRCAVLPYTGSVETEPWADTAQELGR